jgi:hypothetical protein
MTELASDHGLDLSLPVRPSARGPLSAVNQARYEESVQRWCDAIRTVWNGLDFEVGTHEWCYLMEPHGLAKADFDLAETLITKCRKAGQLPLNIIIEDVTRAPRGLEDIDERSVEQRAADVVAYVDRAHLTYTPLSFWQYQHDYVEVATEKASLVSLFEEPCRPYHVAAQNMRGSGDLNVRAGILRRMAKWQAEGKKCTLLYCGDYDVHGVRISASGGRSLKLRMLATESRLASDDLFGGQMGPMLRGWSL